MKRAVYFTIVLGFLISLTPVPVVYAKGLADKITISGPGLANPVEITDPQILSHFSPWEDGYFDAPKGALPTGPKTDRIYQVFIYSKDNNNQLQVRYAFQYVPGQPGYVYLPGKNDPWYEVNIGTILRGSTFEGHWFYASKEWGDFIQPILEGESFPLSTPPPQPAFPFLSSSVELPGFVVMVLLAVVLFWTFRLGRAGCR